MADALYGARASMEPAGLQLLVRTAARGIQHPVKVDSFASCEDDVVRIETSFDGEAIELAIIPVVPLIVEFSQVKLRHAFATGELVLLNGYQSWTDTTEQPAWGRMRGLRGVSRKVVENWTLDGGGDYAAVEYSARRGEQHGFTYGTFRRGDGLVLVGSLDESRGFTLIRADARAGEVLLETEPPLRELAADERVVLGRYAITRGTEAQCYDRYFELSAWQARPAKPLVGYTSWYRHYGDISEAKLVHDLQGVEAFFSSLGMFSEATPAETLAEHPQAMVDGRSVSVPTGIALPGAEIRMQPLGYGEPSGPATLLFQIDDGYCKVGDWLDVDKAKFPQGLAPLAARIREDGFLSGLWVAPFVCEKDSRLFTERPEWLLRDEAGNPVPTGCQWSGGYALDTLNVEVRSYVLEALQTMTREWGFGLLKADFLYAACMIPHGGMNRGELMADAMQLLRTGIEGAGALILGCGVPLGSAFGLVDYCRIGCDVGLDWDDLPHMRLLHRERVSTKNSLGNTYGRAPLDGRAFGNDPDVFFLRSDVKLTDAQRDELLFADADLGSVFLTSDDMGKWTPAMRDRYLQALKVFFTRHGDVPCHPERSAERGAEGSPRSGVEDENGGQK